MPQTDAFSPMPEVSSFRQIAAGMWSHPDDPTIHGSMDLDVTTTLDFISRFRATTGVHLTLTHVVARAVALAFAAHPECNAKVRYWGRLEQRRSVDVFVSVSTGGGKDLGGVRIDGADRLDLAGLARAVDGRVKQVRSGDDPAYQKSRKAFASMPWWLARPAVRLTDLLCNELHLDLPEQGMPRDPFGTAVITNVGSFGIDTAFAPFVPLGRCPMLLLITEVRDRPWVVDGQVVPRPVLRLCATFDHRIIDGHHAGLLAREIRRHVEAPE
jgi:pyruvate/2-oxoglutarate dehydrogenase complex dihydrolipoamide acyltransferase (E2) component